MKNLSSLCLGLAVLAIVSLLLAARPAPHVAFASPCVTCAEGCRAYGMAFDRQLLDPPAVTLLWPLMQSEHGACEIQSLSDGGLACLPTKNCKFTFTGMLQSTTPFFGNTNPCIYSQPPGFWPGTSGWASPVTITWLAACNGERTREGVTVYTNIAAFNCQTGGGEPALVISLTGDCTACPRLE